MRNLVLAVLLPAMLAGCAPAQLPGISSLAYPADPNSGLRRSSDPNIIGDYNKRDVTDPKGWRTRNESQSPAKNGGA